MAEKDYPKGDTSWFIRDRFGMFIHWGLYSMPARHEWVKSKEKLTDEHYRRYFERFDPDLFDPSDWAWKAKSAGMKYFCITTKHHEGFCLWDTAYTDFKITNTPYGKDLIGPMVEAFRAEELKVGFYYSLLDWHHPHYTPDCFHPQRDNPEFLRSASDRDMAVYREYMKNQLTELLTDYGKIDHLFLDFSIKNPETGKQEKGKDDWGSDELVELIRKLQPDIVLNDRLDLPESADFVTPEQYIPAVRPVDENGNPKIWETCQTFSGSWGYHRDESSWKSVKMLLQMLIDVVSMGGNLLLNVGPTARGEFDNRAIESLDGIGEWMYRHGKSIYGCTAAPSEFPPPQDCRYTWDPERSRLYLHFFSWPFNEIHLPGLADRLEYSQLLNDGSEIKFHTKVTGPFPHKAQTPVGGVTLELPIKKPDVEIPVIELFIK